jgi:hypothetical protein
VDRRLLDPLRPLIDGQPVLNPLRSEQEAFRFLIRVAVFFAVVLAIVLIIRAL